MRLYRAADIRPLTETTDPAKVCTFAGQDLVPDLPFHETDLNYSSRSGLLFLTFAGEKLSLVVDAFSITKTKEKVLGARGIKADINVQLGRRSDAGEIQLVDPLEASRPTNVRIAGRSGRITAAWEAVPGSTDYLICIAPAATGVFQPLLVTDHITEIKELPANNLGIATAIQDGTNYRLMMFAHNSGGLSLAAESPAETQDPATAGTKYAVETFMATPQKKVPSAEAPKLVTDKSGYRAELAWEAAEGATAYCLDSACLEAGGATCDVNPKLAHAYLPDTNEKSAVRCAGASSLTRRCLGVGITGNATECKFLLYAVNEGNGVSDPETMTLTIRP